MDNKSGKNLIEKEKEILILCRPSNDLNLKI
jgi:hypothetical protein